MQAAYQDVERHVFWASLLSGAAGLTYGAAGIWHAGVEGDPGTNRVYDPTTWREGMAFPGSTQLGIGKRLLERYPWSRFTPHPEWAEPDAFAAGIPGEVRFVYQPRRGVYDWNGAVVRGVERDVPYHAFYFDPVRGRVHEAGSFVSQGPPTPPFGAHEMPLLADESFDGASRGAWKDHGTPSVREGGRLVGGKGLVTVLESVRATDVMASVSASSDAEAGVVLRFHDKDRYLVALWSPLLHSIFLHDRKDGRWGEPLGQIPVPGIGPRIRLTAAACGDHAALVLTDGERTYATPTVRVTNVTEGATGVWLFQVGERQEFDDFRVSHANFAAAPDATEGVSLLFSDEYRAPELPSPQDWVLVLERRAR
jgi:hypothetical protein